MATKANIGTGAKAAKKAAQAPSKGTVVSPLAALASTVVQAPAVAAPATNMVALRGQSAVTSVQIKAGAVYRTKAQHNLDWWGIITKQAAAKPATVADLTKAGVPAHFIGYVLRRGYMVPTA